MSFAGKVWRLLVGIKDALSLVFLLLFFWALYMVLSTRPNPAAVRSGALLLELDGQVVEETSRVRPLDAVLSSAAPTREFAARDLVHSIDAAAKDGRIKAIALDLSTRFCTTRTDRLRMWRHFTDERWTRGKASARRHLAGRIAAALPCS